MEVAKQEIESHIATRTGAGFIDRDLDFAANGTDVGDDGEIEDQRSVQQLFLPTEILQN